MDFNVDLYLEGGSNALHTRNPEEEEFCRILVMTQNAGAGESPLSMKVAVKELHHGNLIWERRTFKGTLLVFYFQFKSKGSECRYLSASITFEFFDKEGKSSRDPAVIKVSPSTDKDRYLNRSKWKREITKGGNIGLKPEWVDLGAKLELKDAKDLEFSARLTTETHNSKGKNGDKNAVTWSIEQNTGKKDGIPSFLQAAVLLRRSTDEHFVAKLRVKSDVDWQSDGRRLLTIKTDVDKIIDPVTITPITKQVDNNEITNVTDEELQKMEKLPMDNYYKIVSPEEEKQEANTGTGGAGAAAAGSTGAEPVAPQPGPSSEAK
ncbi:hypothetical protein NA56DRAFT_739031 [Hyaloscypha hepaticicola]|uniref:Uncharacterized protein n=1 Tax=Hyaloscypha hepaticicola TaxID=2082293 RepID=A0A2J6PFW8_9HELO|nr:hypothetical protein NA56DRAFT_739031 [Hyaloscypha hepaticicola]